MIPARRTLPLAAVALLACAAARAQAPAVPVDPTPPPPPPEWSANPNAEPQVTVIHRDDNVVEEVRVDGQLRYVRVTPRYGRPYYLVPDVNGNTFIRRDSLDPALKVPMWVLFSF
jgi:hypothetical protein